LIHPAVLATTDMGQKLGGACVSGDRELVSI